MGALQNLMLVVQINCSNIMGALQNLMLVVQINYSNMMGALQNLMLVVQIICSNIMGALQNFMLVVQINCCCNNRFPLSPGFTLGGRVLVRIILGLRDYVSPQLFPMIIVGTLGTFLCWIFCCCLDICIIIMKEPGLLP